MTYRNTLCRSSVPFLLSALLLGACGGDSPDKLIGSAKEYLAKNDPKAAAIQIKSALQKNPDITDGRFLLGKALLESGDPVTAEVELRKALAQKYPENKVIPLLARAVYAQGQTKKLIDEFSRTELTEAESKADLETSLAMAHAALGDAKAAEEAVARALQAAPEYAPALIAQARLKAAARDFAGAQNLVDVVLAKNAKAYDAWKLKGDIQLALVKPEEALASYAKSIESKHDYLPAYIASISVLLSTDKVDEAGKQLAELKAIAPKHPQTIYLSTRYALIKKDFQAARELSQQLLKVMPNNPASLVLAGMIELNFKSLAQAETYLAQALQLAPERREPRRLLAETYLRSGQYVKAQATLAPILEAGTDDPNLLKLAGEVYLQAGDAKRAEGYLTRAVTLDPKDSQKQTFLALAHLAEGKEDAALGELARITTTDTGTSADLALIASYMQRSRLDDALKAIDTLEKKLPDSPAVPNLRGQALLLKKDIAGARSSFERALSLSPSYFPAAASLARLDLDAKKPEDARKRFEGVLAKDPKNGQALLALAELRLRAGDAPLQVAEQVSKAVAADPTEPALRVALIDLYLRAPDTNKALTAAQNAVAAIPNRPELLNALARSLQATGDNNQAISVLNKLSGLQPNSPQPYLQLAEIQIANKNTGAAIQALQRALELNADLIEARRRLVGLYLSAGKTQEAANLARAAQKLHPQAADGYLLEGNIAASRKAWPDAIAAYKTGLKASQSPELATKMHGSLFVSGNKADAERFAVGWLQDHPKDPVFRFYMGEYATSQRDYLAASKYYQAGLQLQPDNVLMLNNLAWVGGQIKDPKALEYAERANVLSPNQPALMDTLAMLVADTGNTDRALQLLHQALILAPKAADIRLNLARVLIKTGKKAEAKAALDEIAKLGNAYPRQGDVVELRKAL